LAEPEAIQPHIEDSPELEVAPLTPEETDLIYRHSSLLPAIGESAHLILGVIETAKAAERISEYIEKTPLVESGRLSLLTGNEVRLKREDQQGVRSFKIRGALNKLLQLTEEERSAGVITASAGNHAQGVASGAKQLGLNATIVMPRTTPRIKIQSVESFGAEIILVGDNYTEAQEHMTSIMENDPKTFIHPFDDVDVIHGQGTIGLEILEQNPDVTHIFIPGGGGGLAAGVSKVVKALNPNVKIIVVEPDDSNCIQLSFRAGKIVSLPKAPSIVAEGVAVRRPGDLTMREIFEYVDDVITVSNDDISVAITNMWQETGTAPEGAGALAEAGMIKYAIDNEDQGQHYVGVVSGANISAEKFRKALERAELASGREVHFSVQLSERPGSLRQFCREVVNGHSISEFHYRRSESREARTYVGISMTDAQDKKEFVNKMEMNGYSFDDLSDDNFAKDYLRYLSGGRSESSLQEAIYEIELPERSGALVEFLDTLHDSWGISLFHYRSFGETSPVLIGFETAEAEILESTLAKAGYGYSRVTSTAIDHFL
jgi:threonine dehydratase